MATISCISDKHFTRFQFSCFLIHCVRVQRAWELRNLCRNLSRKLKGMDLVVDGKNIRIHVNEVEYDDVDLIDFRQRAVTVFL